MKRLHLAEWAEGKWWPVVFMGHQLALSADACFESCLKARQGEWVEGSNGVPPFDDWL